MNAHILIVDDDSRVTSALRRTLAYEGYHISTVANGEVASGAVTLATNTCRVDIDGQPAVVSYAGTSPGAVAGLVQINAVIPPTIKTGAAISITVSAGSAATARRSQPGVTIAVK